jgi:hypothetical protein
MAESARQNWAEPGHPPDAEERRRIQTALRQLDWADTYLLAIVNLELEDHESRLAVAEIRRRTTALELHLRKLDAT